MEELVASYRRTATSYQQHRQLLQNKLSGKLQQLLLAYSRVVSESTAASPEDDDEALMHRHMLMAKLLACVHEARLRDEEDSVEEMARVVRRVSGGHAMDEKEGVVAVIRDMEQLMDRVDEQCWQRIRTKRKQLADMEEEMRRERHEKQQWSQRIAALEQRRQQLEDSMHAIAHTRKRKHSPSVPTPAFDRTPAAVRPHMEPSRMLPSALLMAGGSDDDEDSHEHTSPPLSSTSSATSASKRRKSVPQRPLSPSLQLSMEQFDALTDVEKMRLSRLSILAHCPTIESFLHHQLHLRTLQMRFPDNHWRKLNNKYTGQRKRQGLKGRGRGRQVLPATEEEQRVWREVRQREMALLTGGQVEGEAGAGGGGDGGSGGVEDDEEDDERSDDEGNDSTERIEDSAERQRPEQEKVDEQRLAQHAHKEVKREANQSRETETSERQSQQLVSGLLTAPPPSSLTSFGVPTPQQLHDSNLIATASQMVLLAFMHQPGVATSVQQVAERTRLSVAAVRIVAAELCAQGYLYSAFEDHYKGSTEEVRSIFARRP